MNPIRSNVKKTFNEILLYFKSRVINQIYKHKSQVHKFNIIVLKSALFLLIFIIFDNFSSILFIFALIQLTFFQTNLSQNFTEKCLIIFCQIGVRYLIKIWVLYSKWWVLWRTFFLLHTRYERFRRFSVL